MKTLQICTQVEEAFLQSLVEGADATPDHPLFAHTRMALDVVSSNGHWKFEDKVKTMAHFVRALEREVDAGIDIGMVDLRTARREAEEGEA